MQLAKGHEVVHLLTWLLLCKYSTTQDGQQISVEASKRKTSPLRDLDWETVGTQAKV